mmetsp:Transcript_22192/g.53086  ORF Transcript_22192/g.53086 Transcript_22192/m.53086 type:complete len:412 (+) Transcript_22192:282-1517(+)
MANSLPRYRGVTKKNNTWAANLWFQGKQVYLGTYPSPIMAAQMYDYAARFLLGEKSRFNFPDGPGCAPHSTAKNAVIKAQSELSPEPSPKEADSDECDDGDECRLCTESAGRGSQQLSGTSTKEETQTAEPRSRGGLDGRAAAYSQEEAEAMQGLMSLIHDKDGIAGLGPVPRPPSPPPLEQHHPQGALPPVPTKKRSRTHTVPRKVLWPEAAPHSAPKRRRRPPGVATPSAPEQQQQHSSAVRSSRSKSGYYGVSADRSGKKWVATIHVRGGKALNLGTFRTREEAAMAFDREAFAQRGAAANLNFPEMWLSGSLESSSTGENSVCAGHRGGADLGSGATSAPPRGLRGPPADRPPASPETPGRTGEAARRGRADSPAERSAADLHRAPAGRRVRKALPPKRYQQVSLSP